MKYLSNLNNVVAVFKEIFRVVSLERITVKNLTFTTQVLLKSDSHVPEKFSQIKIIPSLVQKKYHLFVWYLKMKINEF